MDTQSITDRLERHVVGLSGPEYERRLAGTEGETRAADYLVRELEAMGVGTAFGDSYAQPVEIRGTRFTAGATEVGRNP